MLDVLDRMPPRLLNGMICLCAFGLMAYAKYSESFLGLVPCTLCMTQQLCFTVLIVVTLIAVIHNPQNKSAVGYGIGSLLVSILGAGVAARQAWLEILPADQIPACGASVEYIVEVLPLSDIIRYMLIGEGNCGVIQWEFLGLTMAWWAFLWFILFAILNLLSMRQIFWRHADEENLDLYAS